MDSIQKRESDRWSRASFSKATPKFMNGEKCQTADTILLAFHYPDFLFLIFGSWRKNMPVNQCLGISKLRPFLGQVFHPNVNFWYLLVKTNSVLLNSGPTFSHCASHKSYGLHETDAAHCVVRSRRAEKMTQSVFCESFGSQSTIRKNHHLLRIPMKMMDYKRALAFHDWK